MRPWLLLMFLALLGVMLVDRAVRRRDRTPDRPDPLRIAAAALAALSIAFSGASVYWLYRIGHSGSKAVWHSTQVRIDHDVRRDERGNDGD
ncbi:MAG TPA: hypothetical protein VHU90_02305 [Galbitalea sp.]|nr:hypothetical protein [Galbitalea sp.]